MHENIKGKNLRFFIKSYKDNAFAEMTALLKHFWWSDLEQLVLKINLANKYYADEETLFQLSTSRKKTSPMEER